MSKIYATIEATYRVFDDMGEGEKITISPDWDYSGQGRVIKVILETPEDRRFFGGSDAELELSPDVAQKLGEALIASAKDAK